MAGSGDNAQNHGKAEQPKNYEQSGAVRYGAPGDPPLTVPSLEIEVPFVFDGALWRGVSSDER
jgi:hypothetical protein